jgi:hypothetical protein
MDLYKHCRSTVVKDFNNGDKIVQKADVIFALGLLNYIYDIKSLIADIYGNCQVAVITAMSKEENPIKTGIKPSNCLREELITIFINSGFLVKRCLLWKGNTIFIVSKYADNRFLKNPIRGFSFIGGKI